MGCYCGCDTKSNKIKWAVATVLGVISAILWIIYIAEASKCDDNGYGSYEGLEGCSVGLIVFAFYTAILFLIGATIPCYMMCCCTQNPNANNQPVAVVAVPVAGPNQPHWNPVNPVPTPPKAPGQYPPAPAPPGQYNHGQPVPVGTANHMPPPPPPHIAPEKKV